MVGQPDHTCLLSQLLRLLLQGSEKPLGQMQIALDILLVPGLKNAVFHLNDPSGGAPASSLPASVSRTSLLFPLTGLQQDHALLLQLPNGGIDGLLAQAGLPAITLSGQRSS